MDKSSGIQERRSQRRSNLLMAATLEHPGGATTVTLRNLSANGALVEGDHALALGTTIVFRKKELAVAGKIAWLAGRRAGISFETPLDPEMVLHHVPAPKRIAELIHKRPGLHSSMSAEDRKFAEKLWGGPLPSIKSPG